MPAICMRRLWAIKRGAITLRLSYTKLILDSVLPCMANGLTPDFAVDVGATPYVAAEASVISEDAALLSHASENEAYDVKSDAATPQKEVSALLTNDQAVPAVQIVRHVPWYAWPLLIASLVAVSSAAVVFATLPDVPTFTLAAWRLSFTTLLLTPAAVYQYKKLAKDDQKHLVKDIPLVLASGTFLAVHFSFWVWSIHHTSLTHALLGASMAPLLIAIGTLILRKPISKGEILGTGLGLVGVLLLTRASKVDQQVTLAGDFSAFLTAVFFCGYIIIGAHLRKRLPIFLYATPVTGFAAFILSVAALSVREVTLTGSHNRGLFGWITDKESFPKVIYLAIVPGIVGHTGFNAVLAWLPGLLVTLVLTIEPLIGTFIGFFAGVSSIPGVWTYTGGTVLLISTAIVVVAGDKRQQAADAAAVRSQDISSEQKVFFQDAADHADAADIELAVKH